MKKYVVISGSGPDKPGIVERISTRLSEKELNIEDSRMAVLGGEFALILLVSGKKESINWLNKNLKQLQYETGLKLFLRETLGPKERELAPTIPIKFKASGMDHPGIVAELAKIVHRNKANIEVMETKVSPAPLSGTPIFSIECRIALPGSVKISELKRELMEKAEELNMEIEFESIEI